MADEIRVLVVDDKLELAETLADSLLDRGFRARALGSSREALAEIEAGGVELVVTDLRMPEIDGLALLDAAVAVDLPVIVMTAYGAIDSAVEAIRRGAYHYLTKPFKFDELLVFVERAIAERALRREATVLRKAVRDQFAVGNVIGGSHEMQRVLSVIERVAPTDAPILITGETGTGKGVVARAIHGESRRSRGPFVVVNCAALPDSLLESELFGHAKGAFTGAATARSGLFMEADHGTLLLDEVGEMSPALQAKLLHVLESGRIRPLGGSGERPVDVRVLAATHRDLRQRIAEGSFREDLLFRLDVVAIELPPVRARRDDLPRLVDHFLDQARSRHPTSRVTSFSREALACLHAYGWPGNVRELSHVVERCVLLAEGPQVGVADLPPQLREPPLEDTVSFHGEVVPMVEVQRRYARWAYEQLGQKTRTAEKLDVDIKTLNRWLVDSRTREDD